MWKHLLRPASSSLLRPHRASSNPLANYPRLFSATVVNMVIKVGDALPATEVFENEPGNKISIAKEIGSGKGLIIGVPAAFSPACSETHVPGYIASPKTKNAGKVFVVSVNDAFVMKAWAKQLDADKSSGIRFTGDATGEFTKALGVDFDASGLLGNHRSKRYAITVDGGKVTNVAVEPDNIGVSVSAVDEVLS